MIVQLHALFSRNRKIGSRVIACGTKHLVPEIEKTPSHVALLINGRWVHESTGHSGVRVISYDKWSKINEEVAREHLGEIDYQAIADKYREIKDKAYDYMGIAYLALVIIPTFFGFKLPLINKWESNDKYFCCEALGFLTGQYYGMHAPVMIMRDLCKIK